MTKFKITIFTKDMVNFLQTNVINKFDMQAGEAEYIEVEGTSYSNPSKIFRNFSPNIITFHDDNEALLFKLRFFDEITEIIWTNEF